MGRRSTFLLAFFLALVAYVQALHFYLDNGEERCFIEELPSDTIVEGHYRALEWDEKAQVYVNNTNLGIQVDITELETDHLVSKTRGPYEGRFTFTSHDSGDHSICLSSNYTASWFTNSHIRLYLDIVVGAAKHDVDTDRSHASDMANKLRDLNNKLREIRTEQQYQRERERDFRDLSESTNAKAVWYILAQIVVLVLTCAWQLRHLRKFFADRKGR